MSGGHTHRRQGYTREVRSSPSTAGTFIGTETGGTYTCNAATRTIHLTNSKFVILVSQRSFAAAVEGFSRVRGVAPDHPIQPTIDDLIEERDVALEYALNLFDQD